MLAALHFNTETSLVLTYCVVCIALLLALSLNLPYKAKKPINQLVSKSLYYLGIACLLPLWTLLNSLRNLNRFMQEGRDPKSSPLLIDRTKGKIIKMQRNFIMGLFGLVSFVLLYRFHKVIDRYDDNAQEAKEQVKSAGGEDKKSK